jgi:5S rRNA maturation endonuclease (ribonuclease M5)
MKFYDFNEIKSRANCIEIAKHLGYQLNRDNRCAATWRGGKTDTSVQFNPTGYYDYAQEKGGGVIDFVAMVKFADSIQHAQEWLGEYLNLEPKGGTRPLPSARSRYDELIQEGYRETARYQYKDIDGIPIHFTVRLEHPTKGKSFLQGTPHGWGLGDIEPILYNLAGITASPWCCIVEGEKDADTLIRMGILATTCAQVAKKWHAGYAEFFRDKKVAILIDNDEPGKEHGNLIAASLADIAADIRMLTTSQAPKGDVSDYVAEGHTKADIIALIKNANPVDPDDLQPELVPEPEPPEVKDAKQANTIPFRNYVPVQVEKPSRRPGGNPTTETDKQARTITDMTDDIHRRFLGFPRKVGEQLFDHDRDSGEIYYIYKPADLFAWIGRKSKKPVAWGRGDSLADKSDFFSGIQAEALRYESISTVPDWPTRQDVYYVHPKIPKPTEDRRYLWKMVEFFKPATVYDQRLMIAMLIAPLWYIPRVPRPSWIIDSEDGQGTGKSTAIETAAFLYGTEAVRTCQAELQFGNQEITKRLLCNKGRNARILLVDNVQGTFTSPVLADLITAWSISGKRPYGMGEETRPNNITYVITANNATVDTDIASRSYYIFVKKPNFDPRWKAAMTAFIEENRYKVIADIIGMLEDHKPFDIQPSTRFPEFEESILQAVCDTPEMYLETLAHLASCRTDSNIEEEQARGMEEMIRGMISQMGIDPQSEAVWLQSPIVNSWGRRGLTDCHEYKGQPVQLVRSLAKQRLMKMICPRTKRWPHNGTNRSSGVLWNPQGDLVSWEIFRDTDGNPQKRIATQ